MMAESDVLTTVFSMRARYISFWTSDWPADPIDIFGYLRVTNLSLLLHQTTTISRFDPGSRRAAR